MRYVVNYTLYKDIKTRTGTTTGDAVRGIFSLPANRWDETTFINSIRDILSAYVESPYPIHVNRHQDSFSILQIEDETGRYDPHGDYVAEYMMHVTVTIEPDINPLHKLNLPPYIQKEDYQP